MPVHHGRVMSPRDVPCCSPSGSKSERRCHVRRGTQMDIRPHCRRVAEYIQRLKRSVAIEMKPDAVLFRRSRDQRMPRRDDVDVVTAGGN